MRAMVAAMLGLGLAVSGGGALADPDKDESGKGRERGGYARYDEDRRDRPRFERGEARERRAYKEEYDDGRCKVERKFEKNGDYKEERKCRGGGRASRDDAPRYGYRY